MLLHYIKRTQNPNETHMINQKLEVTLISFPREMPRQMLAPSAKNNEKTFSTFSSRVRQEGEHLEKQQSPMITVDFSICLLYLQIYPVDLQ